MKRILSLLLAILAGLTMEAQVITDPGFGLISHETMNVKAIEFDQDNTIIYISLVNMVSDGYFCVDRNTFISLPDGTRLRLLKVDGIPNCPDVYRFKSIGETILFSLTFPAINVKPVWFDIIEECSDNCFSVRGITTDIEINKKLVLAYELSDSGNPSEAGNIFREILIEVQDTDHGILGSLYSSIIIMYLREGKNTEASQWYTKMLESGAPDLNLYIENLSAEGIKW